MSTVHICTSPVVEKHLVRKICPTCGKRRYMTCFSYEWYDTDFTCLKCGERWSGGERLDRPFCPGWRKKSVENAKKQWRRTHVAR